MRAINLAQRVYAILQVPWRHAQILPRNIAYITPRRVCIQHGAHTHNAQHITRVHNSYFVLQQTYAATHTTCMWCIRGHIRVYTHPNIQPVTQHPLPIHPYIHLFNLHPHVCPIKYKLFAMVTTTGNVAHFTMYGCAYAVTCCTASCMYSNRHHTTLCRATCITAWIAYHLRCTCGVTDFM